MGCALVITLLVQSTVISNMHCSKRTTCRLSFSTIHNTKSRLHNSVIPQIQDHNSVIPQFKTQHNSQTFKYHKSIQWSLIVEDHNSIVEKTTIQDLTNKTRLWCARQAAFRSIGTRWMRLSKLVTICLLFCFKGKINSSDSLKGILCRHGNMMEFRIFGQFNSAMTKKKLHMPTILPNGVFAIVLPQRLRAWFQIDKVLTNLSTNFSVFLQK